MLYRLHCWAADRIRWVQYPQVRRVRQVRPAGRIPVSLLIVSVFVVLLAAVILSALLYVAHLIT